MAQSHHNENLKIIDSMLANADDVLEDALVYFQLRNYRAASTALFSTVVALDLVEDELNALHLNTVQGLRSGVRTRRARIDVVRAGIPHLRNLSYRHAGLRWRQPARASRVARAKYDATFAL
jgi:hypothetical protein